MMGTDEDLLSALESASGVTGERVWQLPLHEAYAKQIKSDVADIKNSGGRPAGAITAGMFLKRFASGYPWAHLDIAGMAWSEETDGYVVKGGTGFGVRLLVQWLRDACSRRDVDVKP
jgi:leucyl aminopeptidase